MAMFTGIRAAVGGAVQPMMAPPPPQPLWQTRLSQWSTPPVEPSQCCLACFCPLCTSAAAKSNADKTHPCYNFLCWSPIGAYSWVRLTYHIRGICGDDICYGMWCMPCIIRQMYTETLLRGPSQQPPTMGANNTNWQTSLFDCTPCELMNALLCPCCVVHEIRKNLQPEAAESCCFDSMCILPVAMYGQVRHTYGVLTDFPVCEDLCIPVICAPCALNQAYKMTVWVKRNGLPPPMCAPGGATQGNYQPYR